MSEQLQYQLAQASEHWADQFKNCNKFWTSAARQPEFWKLGAKVCERHDIPPSMLIVLVHNHINDDAQDFAVKFHSNVMKAEGLMERGIANARKYLRECMLDLEAISLVSGIPRTTESGIISMMRSVAELVLEYYRLGLKITLRQGAPDGDYSGMPDFLKDSIAYRSCENNPFLFADVAIRPEARHLAYNNLRALLKYQPWVREIWEGTIRGGHTLTDEQEIAGPRPEEYMFQGVNWSWPPDVSLSYPVTEKPVHPEMEVPRFYIGRPLFQSYVSAVIEAKAEQVRQDNPQLGR